MTLLSVSLGLCDSYKMIEHEGTYNVSVKVTEVKCWSRKEDVAKGSNLFLSDCKERKLKGTNP